MLKTTTMDKGTKFDSGYTRATMETMGFATCNEGYHGFVRFLFHGDEYEIVRYRNCACLGTVLKVTSDPELDTYFAEGEELMEVNPDIQGFFSIERSEFRFRIWGSCTTIEEFSGFVRDALDRLDRVQDTLKTRVLRRVYEFVGPTFESILSSGSHR